MTADQQPDEERLTDAIFTKGGNRQKVNVKVCPV